MMGYPCKEGDYIVFRIRANRFLRNMVRAIVGSLIEVGRGKKDPSWILELIASGNRSDAGSSVPGNALFLTGAEYPDDI
jgi:tRNA pseudouridine38-40 synthase